jgi:hypothetical protein
MKLLLRAVVVLVVLGVAVDFGAKLLVENLAAKALASRRGMNGSVEVTFGGFPFLLSLTGRHFASVTIEAEDVRGGGLETSPATTSAPDARIESVTLELDDVDIEGQVWRDDAGGHASAASGGGQATLSQNALNRMVPGEYSARLLLRDGSISVSANTPFGAREVEVAEDDVRIEGGAGAGVLVIQAPSPVGAISVPLPNLVDGVHFDGLDVEAGALTLTFDLRDVDLAL